MNKATNNVLVVTGGASGIGLACAKRIAVDHGKVILLDLNTEATERAVDELQPAGVTAAGITCDGTDATALVKIADQIEADHGPVDTLVTSAGVISNSETLMEMDLDRHCEV